MTQAEIGAHQRARILELLASGPGTTAQLAEALHLSLNAIGYHLRSLEQAGKIRRLRPPHGRAPLWSLVPQETP